MTKPQPLEIRLIGSCKDVAAAIAVIRQEFEIVGESIEYSTREGVGVRRYLHVRQVSHKV